MMMTTVEKEMMMLTTAAIEMMTTATMEWWWWRRLRWQWWWCCRVSSIVLLSVWRPRPYGLTCEERFEYRYNAVLVVLLPISINLVWRSSINYRWIRFICSTPITIYQIRTSVLYSLLFIRFDVKGIKGLVYVVITSVAS